MLRIIETFRNLPESFYAPPPNSFFHPGQVATLIDDKTADVCWNGTNPLGIIDDIRTSTDDSTFGSKRLTVWTKNMIVDTDMFDTMPEYHKYNNLYVFDGLFTTRRLMINAKCVGIVLQTPSLTHPLLRVLFDLKGNIEIGGK